MICTNCNIPFANFSQRINGKLVCYPCVKKLDKATASDFNPKTIMERAVRVANAHDAVVLAFGGSDLFSRSK